MAEGTGLLRVSDRPFRCAGMDQRRAASTTRRDVRAAGPASQRHPPLPPRRQITTEQPGPGHPRRVPGRTCCLGAVSTLAGTAPRSTHAIGLVAVRRGRLGVLCAAGSGFALEVGRALGNLPVTI